MHLNVLVVVIGYATTSLLIAGHQNVTVNIMREIIREITLGKYLTRNGREVIVDRIIEPEHFTFPVKGSVLIPKEKGGYVRKFNIWQLNGKSKPWGDSPLDLVKRIAE